MSRVVSIRLKDEQFERLSRTARQFSKKPSETAAQLLEEAIRREEYPFVEIRPTPSGRLAFIRGTRLPVYDVAIRAREGQSAAEIAQSLRFHVAEIQGALAYAARYADEIDTDIADDQAIFDRLFPDAHKDRVTPVDASAS
jgi:uncharacterized protein (DUF433 family)